MKKWEKLAYLKDVDIDLFTITRNQVKEELSEKFDNIVDSEVIKRLQRLLPKNVSNG